MEDFYLYLLVYYELRMKGNHDKSSVIKNGGILSQRFVFVKDVHFLVLQHKGKKYEIFLSHYPHRSWPKSYHGSIHLFGHTHSNLPPWGLSFDVGVDNIYKLYGYFGPISIDQVIEQIEILKPSWDRDKVR